MIATVDKFANVPWEGRTGAFFGHVDRHDELGFYGAAEPREGRIPFDLCVESRCTFFMRPRLWIRRAVGAARLSIFMVCLSAYC